MHTFNVLIGKVYVIIVYDYLNTEIKELKNAGKS